MRIGKAFLVIVCYELKKQKQKIMSHAQDNEWINSAYRDENLQGNYQKYIQEDRQKT